jgi:hypothetical protein
MKSSLRKFFSLFFEDEAQPPRHSKPIQIVFAVIYGLLCLYWVIDGICLFNKIDLSNIRNFIIPLFLLFQAIDYLTSKKKKN